MKLAALAALLSLTLAALLGRATQASPGAAVRVPVIDPDAQPTRGPKTALVTVELFFVPFNNSRSTMWRAVHKLAADHPSTVRIVYRIIRGSSSSRLHYAALEAYAEGKFDAFFAQLDKLPNQNVTDAQLRDLAQGAGMNVEQLALVLANPPAAFDRILDEDQRRLRQRVRIGGTPQVVVNGALMRSADAQNAAELERAYVAARETALDLLDRGVARADLPAALEALAAPNPLDIVLTEGALDDRSGDDTDSSPQLAQPALDLRGMPSLGPADARVTVAVLCSPTSANCAKALRAAQVAQDVYADSVRVVWAPFFDVSRDDAKELGELSDAALCAERVGTSTDDFGSPVSPGWEWLLAVLDVEAKQHRRAGIDQLLGPVAERLHVEEPAFAQCRAKTAGAAIRWIEHARHAGVRVSPSTVVGGRIYPAIDAAPELQQLIGAELDPGDCDGCLRLQTLAP